MRACNQCICMGCTTLELINILRRTVSPHCRQKSWHSSFFGRTGAVYEGEDHTSVELMRSFADLTPDGVPVLYPVNDSVSLLYAGHSTHGPIFSSHRTTLLTTLCSILLWRMWVEKGGHYMSVFKYILVHMQYILVSLVSSKPRHAVASDIQ